MTAEPKIFGGSQTGQGQKPEDKQLKKNKIQPAIIGQ